MPCDLGTRHPFAIAVALLLTACGALPAATSGQIGCAESDITIENEHYGWSTSTWTARCKGKLFFCSRISDANDKGETHCKEATPNAPNAPNAPSASASAPTAPEAAPTPAPVVDAAGCKYDTQCKGDRICERGACVSPPAAAAPAP